MKQEKNQELEQAI